MHPSSTTSICCYNDKFLLIVKEPINNNMLTHTILRLLADVI